MILTFDNQDDVNTTGPHNVSIYTDDTLAEVLFKGDLVNGPATVDYQVPALQPGDVLLPVRRASHDDGDGLGQLTRVAGRSPRSRARW